MEIHLWVAPVSSLIAEVAPAAEAAGTPIWVTLLQLLAVVLLVLANGYFVASEFSLVSVRKTRIDQLVAEGSARARTVRNALDHTDDFIAATQLGITMASWVAG